MGMKTSKNICENLKYFGNMKSLDAWTLDKRVERSQ